MATLHVVDAEICDAVFNLSLASWPPLVQLLSLTVVLVAVVGYLLIQHEIVALLRLVVIADHPPAAPPEQ